jgi:hypothetical protein
MAQGDIFSELSTIWYEVFMEILFLLYIKIHICAYTIGWELLKF